MAFSPLEIRVIFDHAHAETCSHDLLLMYLPVHRPPQRRKEGRLRIAGIKPGVYI